MRSGPFLIAIAFGIACNSDNPGPRPDPDADGARIGSQFERLADSVDAGGYSPAAEALRHAAEIVRLTGHATPVRVTVDDAERSFLAVAEQIDFPNLVCSWPGDSGVAPPPDTVSVPPTDTVGTPPIPPDTGRVLPPIDSGGTIQPDTIPIPVDSGLVRPPECHPEGTSSMRTLIAWEPNHMAEVVRLVAYIGSSGVEPNVPDVMTELPGGPPDPPPSSTPPDSGTGSGGEPGGFPGFMGEFLVRDVGSWYASSGNQANDLLGEAGSCTAGRAMFDWAEFGCEAARFRFEFSMQVDPVRYGPVTDVSVDPGPEGRHHLAMAGSAVDGVRLTWISWNPPPLPPGPGPDPIPVDTTGARP